MKRTALIIGLLAVVSLLILTVIVAKANNDLRRKIGQMLIIGFFGTEAPVDSYIARVIKEVRPGGVILFDYDVPFASRPRNITDPEQTKRLVADLRSYSVAPLFVAVDLEGGMINRLKPSYGFADFPSHEELGQKNDLVETEKVSSAIAKELADLGFNLNFAPVVDVNVNPENPVIGSLGRSFSNDPAKIVAHALAFIRGHRANNIIAAIKHFPGHGSSKQDSHLGLVDITETYQESELIPYEKITKQGVVDMVMTAHVINKKIDPDFPVTLSSKYIQPILRERFGFNGVVVSDDMNMGAIVKHYGFKEALVRAVNAGSDLLIISNNGETYDEQAPYAAKDAIFEAVKKGQISETRINESYQRIRQLKERFGLAD